MAELGTVVALIKSMSGADPEVIEQAVQDWLDDHPEATTTVQDGSITEAKLAQDVLADLAEIDTLSEAIVPLTPAATSGDVGKFLKAKTVSGGKVTEYEFGSGSGGGAEIDDTAGHGDTTVVWSAGKTYDEIEKVKPGDYRLLKEVIISGADTKAVMVDTDTNGDPFIVHEMMIDFELTACSGTSNALVMPNQTTELWTSADLIPYLAVQNLFSSSGSQRRTARLKVEGGRFFGESEASSFDNHYGSVNSQRSRNATGIYECDPISAVRIWSINGHFFGDGTKIKIYGR